MRKIYTPHAGSVAAQCIDYFRANPQEELGLDDIATKFGANRLSIHTLLRPALDAGHLSRVRDQDGDYHYKAGRQIFDALLTAEVQTPAPKPAAPVATNRPCTPRKTPQNTTPKMVDIDALVVETGVPYTRTSTKGWSKWTDLFCKLQRKGESLAIPIEIKGAVASAALKYNKTHPDSKYAVAMTSKTEARVWRTA